MDNQKNSQESLLGYAWLQKKWQIDTVAQLPLVSILGRTRATRLHEGVAQEWYPPSYGVQTPREHLLFALKHEGVNLEFLARLFAKMPVAELSDWLKAEPSSQYARKAGFFYEWLTGAQVPGHELASGNYVDAINAQQYLSATKSEQNRRWRINDNLPGTPVFCPMVRLTPQVRQASEIDFKSEIDQLAALYGDERILRSVNWLTVKESRASFAIEREAAAEDRIQRFAQAMATHCGKMEDPLSEASLLRLQDAILGEKTAGFSKGLRRSPVFVGHNERHESVVDYIAPHHDQTAGMLDGLRAFAARTIGKSSVLRASVLSFGFVYIHPMADGNGRISRFLINDTLRRDQAIPAPLILPVSAIISASLSERAIYDRTLEAVSKPLMDQCKGHYAFNREKIVTHDDGVKSNFEFDGWQESAPAWRYLDLTGHASYLGEVVHRSITQGIGDEAKFLQRFDRARAAVKDIVEGRDEDIDRMIRSITETSQVSNKLRKAYPTVFADEQASQRISSAILQAFNNDPVPEDDDFEGAIGPVRLRDRG